MTDHDAADEHTPDGVADDDDRSDRPQDAHLRSSEQSDDIAMARERTGVDPQASITADDPSNAEARDRLAEDSGG